MSTSGIGGWFESIPPVTKNIIIINLIVWLVEILFPGFCNRVLYQFLALHYFGADNFNPVQIVTYMFMHDATNPMHLFFNMFTLWMFGRILEKVWGSGRFLLFYMVCGIGAAIVQEGVWSLTWYHDYVDGIAHLNGMTYQNMNDVVQEGIASGSERWIDAIQAYKSGILTIGASGAVYGLLLGFAFVFPNMPLYLFFIPVPIKAKWMVIGYGVIEFFLGVAGGGTIAHFAHLGGMLFGLIMLLYWRKKGNLHGL